MSIFSYFLGKPVRPEPDKAVFKVYVIKLHNQTWHKIVSAEKPVATPGYSTYPIHTVIGPLRSEVDAEELVDRFNLANNKQFRLYSKE